MEDRRLSDQTHKINSIISLSSTVVGKFNGNVKNQKKWTPTEDEKLLSLVDGYKDGKIKWQEVSSHFFPGKTTRQCYSKFRQINPKLNKGAWTPKEDEELLYYYKKFGKKWSKLATLITTRSSKQIRDRYLNVLDEKVCKKPFTPQEDKKILELINLYGSNWIKLAKEFPGRTGDNIKNRFNWSIRHTLEKPIDFKSISILFCVIILDESISKNKSNFSQEKKKRRRFKKHSKKKSSEEIIRITPRDEKRSYTSLNSEEYYSNITFLIIKEKLKFEENFQDLNLNPQNRTNKSSKSYLEDNNLINSYELPKNLSK